ncbi:MAG: ATP-binding protein [Prochlorothrix sp.]|nr:ATP-binding protein [Prochlorothrix sp.]
MTAPQHFCQSVRQNTPANSPQPCCLNDIIADLTEEFTELATAANVDLTSKIPETTIQVKGHESQLYRLISNLMANAIQYTPSGGSVRVRLATQDRWAVITVQDTGIGIPMEDQDRIFERFYRVNDDRCRKTGGTGLGLALAQTIVQQHGGRIWVDSQAQQGSCFTVQLKCLRVD